MCICEVVTLSELFNTWETGILLLFCSSIFSGVSAKSLGEKRLWHTFAQKRPSDEQIYQVHEMHMEDYSESEWTSDNSDVKQWGQQALVAARVAG